MEQKKILRIVFVALFIAIMISLLALTGHFIRSILTKTAAQCDQASTVIIQNRTDQEIEIKLQSRKEQRQVTTIPTNARGCFTLQDPEARLEGISVTYNKRHYHFYDKAHLNSYAAPHYFAVMIVEKEGDPNRPVVQEKVGRQLKDKRYMVLSAYEKLGAPLGEDARVQAQKMR